jgi:predicted SnoaL-like aldol condensation-catalyzing enzyme
MARTSVWDRVEGDSNRQKTIQQKTKDLVLEAFDTRFNKRDYARAETFWPPHYVQHSADISSAQEVLK